MRSRTPLHHYAAPKPAVYAAGCVRRRPSVVYQFPAAPTSTPVASAIVGLCGSVCNEARQRCIAVAPLYGEGRLAAENLLGNGDNGAVEGNGGDVGDHEPRVVHVSHAGDGKGTGERGKKLTRQPKGLTGVQLQQRGLIHRLITLEERGDWRGLLTALVRGVQLVHSIG